MKGIIAGGGKLTCEAGATMFKQGGNAFDACLASVFAGFVTEAMLTSAAGAGMATLSINGKRKCVDMGANYPGLEGETKEKPVKAVVKFGEADQTFYLGYPSISVGGNLQGLIYIFEKYCTLPLNKILEPTIEYGKQGVKVNWFQAYLNRILKPMCTYTKEARDIFTRDGELIGENEIIYNKGFGKFLERLGKDKEKAMEEYIRKSFESVKEKGCNLGKRDLEEYEVKEKNALKVSYKGYEINTSAQPSSGGILTAYSLKEFEKEKMDGIEHNGVTHIKLLVDAMKKADGKRTKKFYKELLYNKKFKDSFFGNTTHVSVLDEENNAIGITTSNGQGAGIIVGDTGIMYNNYLGEEDLMQYRELYKPGKRITTMVTPTIVSKDGEVKAVLGTGGSKRIRSAVFQTIVNLIDFGMDPEKAVSVSRVYPDEYGMLQLEGGIRKEVAKELSNRYNIKLWKEKNLFFGGVHIVTPNSGSGDKRRNGYMLNIK